MKNTIPFLYQYHLNGLIYTPEKTIIQAGPSMGKSTFIQNLSDAYKKDNKPITYVEGSKKNAEESVKVVIDWCQSDDQKMLLIDNLDAIYNHELEYVFRDLNRAPDKVVIATSCTPSRARFLGNNKVTGLNELPKKSHSSGFNSILMDSFGLTSFASMWLYPWGAQWRERVGVVILRIMEDYAVDIKDIPNGKKASQFLSKEIESICQKIISISGGHPFLLHRTIMAFTRQLISRGVTNNTHFNKDSVETLFSASIPIIKDNCISRIHDSFKWAESLLSPVTYHAILQAVINGDKPSNRSAIRLFQQAGILNSQIEHTAFVCDIVKEVAEDKFQEIKNITQLPIPSTDKSEIGYTITLKPSHPDNTTGNLICHVSDQPDLIVKLSPTEWEIITYMQGHEGKLVTIKSIIDNLSHHTEASIRSALQRLTNKLLRENIQNLLVNRPRKGYIYNTSLITITTKQES